MDRHRPRVARPSVERLEYRDLPSAALYLAAARLRATRQVLPLVAAPIDSPGVLTPREARRGAFVAKFVAEFTTGPPQLTNESMRISIVAKKGGSNQFLHGVALVAINLPADASSPVDRAFASIYPQNVATTGSVLALDLNADPSAGPPTHLTWTVGGGSGGLYSGAVAARPGTLDIRYIPTHRSPGGFTSGHAVLVFRGTLLVTGVGNIVGTGL